jgi:hypothetical protein
MCRSDYSAEPCLGEPTALPESDRNKGDLWCDAGARYAARLDVHKYLHLVIQIQSHDTP